MAADNNGCSHRLITACTQTPRVFARVWAHLSVSFYFFSLSLVTVLVCVSACLSISISSSVSLRVCDMRKTYTYNFFSDNPDIESGLGCRNYFQLFSPEHRGQDDAPLSTWFMWLCPFMGLSFIFFP